MLSVNNQANQPNFQGNLYRVGVKLPKKKFDEVAKLFAQKTEGFPDAVLVEETFKSIEGDMVKSTCLTSSNNLFDVAILTSDFNEKFNKYAPKTIANELANAWKSNFYENEISRLRNESEQAQKLLVGAKNKVKVMAESGRLNFAKNYVVIASSIDAKITRLNTEIEKLRAKEEKLKVKWIWC